MARDEHGTMPEPRPTAGERSDAERYEVDVVAFADGKRRRVDVRNPAPFGWPPAVVLGLIALVDRADAAMVGGVLPKLQEDFGFSDGTAGILLSAPSVAALVLVVLAGKLADTRTRKNVLVIVIASWGLLTFGAAAAPTFALFFLARVLLGMATPLNIPASASIAGDLYMSKARTKAFAILRVMEYLGFPTGVMVGGVIAGSLGWRFAFLVMGVPALLLSAFVALWLKEPRRGLADDLQRKAEAAGVVTTEVQPITDMGEAPDAGNPVSTPGSADPEIVEEDVLAEASVWTRTRTVLAIPTLRAIILGQALLFAGFSGLFGFATLFFVRVNGLPDGAAAGIAGGMGLIGLSLGGVLASRVGDRYHGIRPAWRIVVSAYTLVGASMVVLVFAFVPVLPLQIGCYLLINFANIIALSNLGAATADVIPASMRGTGFAVMQFLVTIGSSVGAMIVGFVSGIVIRRETDTTQTQVNEAEDALDAARDAGASAAEIADLESRLTGLEDLFFPAQATGIQWGVGTLFLVFVVGGLLMFRAATTYEVDARKALEDHIPEIS